MASSTIVAADTQSAARPAERGRHGIDKPLPPIARAVFVALLIGGLAYAGYSIVLDTRHVGETLAGSVFLFLGLALVIALGFEFVNGFHDTANAVATVIYTNAMPAPVAVVWSGVWNFVGVICSSGAVAYTIITLLPVDLILNVGSASGYAMIFALLLAAVGWNLATWYVGLPNSSSHALIGSILGVGLANQLLAPGGRAGTAGLDWGQVEKVLSTLLVSPLIGFGGALLLMLVLRRVVPSPRLYDAPKGDVPPPRGIRALLVFACTAVSFAHGGNDGQKGMGLIMLILIGCAPTAYALNRAVPASETPAFVQSTAAAAAAFRTHAGDIQVPAADARTVLTRALQAKKSSPQVYAAIDAVARDVGGRLAGYGSLGQVPSTATPNMRNDMYLVLDASRLVAHDGGAPADFTVGEAQAISAYQKHLERGTRYIPTWVKITVALALGLGTMVGWKRIVQTVGEKIGSREFTYGMGASAQLMAASTILLAQFKGLPVSTTHILTSGVAGAAVGNGQALQRRTIVNMVLAWVLTLPIAMTLSGLLYWAMLSAVRVAGM